MARRDLPGLALIAIALSGCAYGFRGGPGVTLGTSGRAVVEGTITAEAGFGSTHSEYARADDEIADAIMGGLTLAGGADPGTGGGRLLGVFGLQYTRIAEQGSPLGFRAGLGLGGEWSRDTDTRVLIQVTGGPLLRLSVRSSDDDPLMLLGLDLSGGLSFNDDESEGVMAVAITLGFLGVERRFHF